MSANHRNCDLTGSVAQTPSGDIHRTAKAALESDFKGMPFDPVRLLSALIVRWKWLVLGAFALGIAGGLVGLFKFSSEYKAAGQLMRQEPVSPFRASELGEPFKPRQLSVATLVSFMKSPSVLQRVADQTQLPAHSVAMGMKINPERNTDLISLSFSSSRSAQTAVRVMNTFGNEVVRLTREMQSQESADMNRLLKKQLSKAEEDLRAVNQELLEYSRQAGLINADKEIDAYLRSLGDLDMRCEASRIEYETLDLKIDALTRELVLNNPLAEKVDASKERLRELLQQYTEENPLVQEQKSLVSELESRLKDAAAKPITPPRQGESGLAAAFYSELLNLKTHKQVVSAQLEKYRAVRAGVEEKLRGLPEKSMQLARIKARQQSLEAAQSLLASRQREAQIYEENALGYYRYFESRLDEVEVLGRASKVLLMFLAGGFGGLLFGAALICAVELSDDLVKTRSDLRRVTGLPLLACLPPLSSMDAVAQSGWAFRAWLALKTKLGADNLQNIVVGFVAQSRKEGISTWMEMLGRAAAQREEAVLIISNKAPLNGSCSPLRNAITNPETVAARQGYIQWLILPPDWQWDADSRQRFQTALRIWGGLHAAVVFVELTCVDQPETILMAESLSQLIWVADSGRAKIKETRQTLQTCRDAGCRFAGAVLNRENNVLSWS